MDDVEMIRRATYADAIANGYDESEALELAEDAASGAYELAGHRIVELDVFGERDA